MSNKPRLTPRGPDEAADSHELLLALDTQDPLAAPRGILLGLLLSFPLWAGIIALVMWVR